MPMLYDVHLSTHKLGAARGPVRATPAVGVTGHYSTEDKALMYPDLAAVAECLPHYYRAAFHRANKWFPREGNGPAYATLYSSRGKYLNTVYLQPRTFNAED